MSKRAILEEIKRIAAANGGTPPGEVAFRTATGIPKSAWWPDIWVNWGDAIQAAGLTRNEFRSAIDETVLFEKYVGLVRELGHLPVHGELRRKKKSDPSFPGDNVFLSRFGGKDKLLSALLTYCRAHSGNDDVINLCSEYLDDSEPKVGRSVQGTPTAPTTYGYVYLIKSGRHHKIGRTNSVGRREWELGIKIPIPPRTIHFIKTDDPVGIEAYWHNRFREKRGAGEWFDLSQEDVAAFKRWKKLA